MWSGSCAASYLRIPCGDPRAEEQGAGEDPMPGEAELILFGIQAALRINQQFRHAYADSTRSRAITLPLPNFPAAPDRSSMENFYRFGDGKEFAGRNPRGRWL